MVKPNPGKIRGWWNQRRKEGSVQTMAQSQQQTPVTLPVAILATLAQKTSAVIAATYGAVALITSVAAAIAAAWIGRWIPEDLLPSYVHATLVATPVVFLLIVSLGAIILAAICFTFWWKNRQGPDSK